MNEAAPSRGTAMNEAAPSFPPPPDTGRRLKTLDGGVRLQVRLPFCRCTPPVPHATDEGVCGACGNAIRRGVGQAEESCLMAALLACPFCGKRTAHVYFKAYRCMAIICDTCGARGPEAMTEEDAVESWETRHLQPEEPV